MKSNKQILLDKPQLDIEQQECIQLFPAPQKWTPAPELDAFFDHLNKKLFKNILPKVPCYWSPPVRSFLGRCHARVHPKTQNMHSIALEFPCNSPDGTLYETMIHEMVHVYQTVLGVPLSHNRLFHSINRSKRVTYLHQKKGNLEPLLYPPRRTKQNRMWHRARDIEEQLQELSELLFDRPVPIPVCWWHSTKTKSQYTLESYWCHTEQVTKPNILELSQKSFSPNEYHLIYILCTIASWRAVGNHKRREYRNELFMRKKQEYFGDIPQKNLERSESTTIDPKQFFSFLHAQHKQKKSHTPLFISGRFSSGKTHAMHHLYSLLSNEDS